MASESSILVIHVHVSVSTFYITIEFTPNGILVFNSLFPTVTLLHLRRSIDLLARLLLIIHYSTCYERNIARQPLFSETMG